MSQLMYLAAAIGISVIGSLIVYVRHGRPRSIEQGVQEFREVSTLWVHRSEDRERQMYG